MKKKTKLLIRDAFFSTILSSLLLLILSLAFFNIRFFNPLHKAFNDFHFLDVFYSESFFNDDTKVISDIVLINIENKNRNEISEVLKIVLEEDPSVVGIDIIFKDLKEDSITDQRLSKQLKHKKVVTSCRIYDDYIEYSHPDFMRSKKQCGYVNINFDKSTSVIREFIGKTSISDKDKTSFASLIAKKHLGKDWKKFNHNKKITNLQYITYYGHYDKFQFLDFIDFNDYERKEILKDKIVLMGYLGTPTGNNYDINDKYFTPLNKYSTGKSDADMFGVTVHANIVNSLIKNDLIFRVNNFWVYIITFLSMFLATMYYMKLNKYYKISYRTRKQIFQLVFAVVLFSLSLLLFKYKIVFPFALIIIGVILAGGYFKYYKHLTRYINKKRKWKTYLK